MVKNTISEAITAEKRRQKDATRSHQELGRFNDERDELMRQTAMHIASLFDSSHFETSQATTYLPFIVAKTRLPHSATFREVSLMAARNIALSNQRRPYGMQQPQVLDRVTIGYSYDGYKDRSSCKLIVGAPIKALEIPRVSTPSSITPYTEKLLLTESGTIGHTGSSIQWMFADSAVTRAGLDAWKQQVEEYTTPKVIYLRPTHEYIRQISRPENFLRSLAELAVSCEVTQLLPPDQLLDSFSTVGDPKASDLISS